MNIIAPLLVTFKLVAFVCYCIGLALQCNGARPPALPLYPREGWHVGNGVVAGSDNDVVEILGPKNLVLIQVLDHHSEVVFFFVVCDVLDNVAEGDHALDIFPVPSSLQIVKQDLPGWKRWNRLSVMLFEGVVWKFEAFLWSI